MTVTRTAASTIVTALNTINATVLAVGKVVDSATSSVDMLDNFVQRAKNRQIDTHKVEDLHWRKNLILDASQAQEKIETDLVKVYQADPVRNQRFNSIVSDLEALFAPTETQP